LQDHRLASNSEILIASAGETFHLTSESSEPKDCPVSIRELRSMFAKYGPHDTSLGFDAPAPSAAG
jgi:hypothetical protein